MQPWAWPSSSKENQTMGIVPEHKAKAKVGDRFGKLVVIGLSFYVRYPSGKVQSFVCQCDCGNCTCVVYGDVKKRAGATQSCGCIRKRHGGDSGTRLYQTWADMRGRCS